MGHYATALVAYQKVEEKKNHAPFWLFLLASQFLDFIMLFFVATGWELFKPDDFRDASFSNMQTDLFYSHGIVPAVIWSLIFALIVWSISKNRLLALWCGILVVFHEVCDLIVGFEHYIFGQGTPAIGLNLYNKAPLTGLIIEALFCVAIAWWFLKRRSAMGQAFSKRRAWGLYIFIVGVIVSTFPIANTSLNELFLK